MRANLVDESQPFGEVFRTDMHPGSGRVMPHKNVLGATSERFNEGANQTQSFANKAPGAHEAACKNANNPFAFVGKSFPSGPTFVGMWPSPL